MEGTLSRGLSSNQYVEKGFLYLLVLSVLLHVAGFTLIYLWPKEERKLQEPTFIDLQDMPELKTTPQSKVEPQKVRPSDQRRRVLKEAVPKGDMQVSRQAARPRPRPQSQPTRQASRPAQPPGPAGPQQARAPQPKAGEQVAPGSSANELLRRKPAQPTAATGGGGGGGATQPQLMPSASRMAKLEENYRRRYADDIADGDTVVGINTNDVLLGSFLRRFETAVYGVWRYPQEAAQKGIGGVTPVKITFNRNGDIVKVKLLESSGSRILDDEVFRTLRLITALGGLPKNYPRDEFNLIAFFQYGGGRRLR